MTLTGSEDGIEILDLISARIQSDRRGPGHFLDGSIASDPLNWAVQARKLLGERIRIFGFWAFENTCATALEEIRERHDFAVLDERVILDGWVARFHPGLAPAATRIGALAEGHRLYGRMELWERDIDMEEWVDAQAAASPCLSQP